MMNRFWGLLIQRIVAFYQLRVIRWLRSHKILLDVRRYVRSVGWIRWMLLSILLYQVVEESLLWQLKIRMGSFHLIKTEKKIVRDWADKVGSEEAEEKERMVMWVSSFLISNFYSDMKLCLIFLWFCSDLVLLIFI